MEYCGFVPTEGQQPILESAARFRLVAGGERAGKSRTLAEDLLSEGVDEAKRKRALVLIWLIAKEYEGTRKEFSYMVENIQKLGVLNTLSFPDRGPCTALAAWDGSAVRIKTRCGKDAKRVMMEAPHLIGACEVGQLPYETYLKLHGRLAEHRGKFMGSGTFEEPWGWMPELFNEWQIPGADGVSFSLPSWSNIHVFPGGREDPEIERLERVYGDVPGLFEAKCGGVPTPPVGLVFREFSHLIHVSAEKAEYVKGEPVYLGIDPSRGTNPYAVGAFQTRMGDEIHAIDEIYEVGRICEQVIEIAREREGLPSRPRRLMRSTLSGGYRPSCTTTRRRGGNQSSSCTPAAATESRSSPSGAGAIIIGRWMLGTTTSKGRHTSW